MNEVFNAIVALAILAVVVWTIILGMLNGSPPDDRQNNSLQDELYWAKRRDPNEPHQPPE